MAKRFFTRKEIQAILEQNTINADVFYQEREEIQSQNAIVYYKNSPINQPMADDGLHMKKARITIAHYRKRKLDSIEKLIEDNFKGIASSYTLKDTETDYFISYYDINIFTDYEW